MIHRHDPDSLAERLDRMLAEGRQAPPIDDDPLMAAARRLADAPHPRLSAEAEARLLAQIMAAARQMPSAPQRVMRPARISWPLAAAAALMLMLAVILVPQVGDRAAAPALTASPSPTLTVTTTPTLTLTATPSPTPTPTFTLTPPVATPDATPADIESGIELEVIPPAPTATPGPAIGPRPGLTPTYDCSNPPPDNAPAPGWRAQCEGAPLPSTANPGHSGGAPGNRENAPGQRK